jgi:hypothetical protein|tara:strand:+ start:616 stop:807 length:192 start_codon:yes stop_codon:yes gene_type:complete
MAFYIKKKSVLLDSKTVYYKGDAKWTDTYADRKSYSTGDDAAAEMANPDGKNGGFTGSTVEAE